MDKQELVSFVEVEKRHNNLSTHTINLSEAHDWLSHRGIEHRYLAYLNAHPTVFDSICLNFPDIPQSQIDHGVQRCNFYLPHLSNLIVSARPFLLLKARFNAVLEVLDRFRLGVFFLSAQGEVIETNEAAKEILTQKDSVILDGRSRIRSTDQAADQRLSLAVAQTTHNQSGTTAPIRFVLPRDSQGTDLLCEVSSILHEDIPVGTMIIISDPENSSVINTEHFGELFGLTQAEQNICQLLTEGYKSGAIAEMRNTGLETVRGQIKSVLNKTGTNGQTDLVRLALSINIPVDDKPTTDK